MADDFLLELILIFEAIKLMLGPCLTLRLRDGGWIVKRLEMRTGQQSPYLLSEVHMHPDGGGGS